ncbi:unnamed protein product, partial [Ixodes pacificus]
AVCFFRNRPISVRISSWPNAFQNARVARHWRTARIFGTTRKDGWMHGIHPIYLVFKRPCFSGAPSGKTLHLRRRRRLMVFQLFCQVLKVWRWHWHSATVCVFHNGGCQR